MIIKNFTALLVIKMPENVYISKLNSATEVLPGEIVRSVSIMVPHGIPTGLKRIYSCVGSTATIALRKLKEDVHRKRSILSYHPQEYPSLGAIVATDMYSLNTLQRIADNAQGKCLCCVEGHDIGYCHHAMYIKELGIVAASFVFYKSIYNLTPYIVPDMQTKNGNVELVGFRYTQYCRDKNARVCREETLIIPM